MYNIKILPNPDLNPFDKEAFLNEINYDLISKNKEVTFTRIYPSLSSHLVCFQTQDINKNLVIGLFNSESVFRVYY